MRVFLDANVLFSASNAGSNVARLIQRLFENGTAVTSDFALEEASRNVELKRPNWIVSFKALSAQVEVAQSVRFELSVELADKDAPILCTGIRAGCEALVTGDKRHFGHLYGQTIKGVTIMSLIDFANALERERG